MESYHKWYSEQTPENMGVVIKDLMPTINSEVHRMNGPREVLRSRAKTLAIQAVKSYNPQAGTHLRSWVTTQLQPLSRYTHSLKTVKPPELVARQAAELNRITLELEDDLGRTPTDTELSDRVGLSLKRIKHIRDKAIATMTEGNLPAISDDDNVGSGPQVLESDYTQLAKDTVYHSLDARDKAIFDMKTGRNGKALQNQEIAKRLGISPALVSQRSKAIANDINRIANMGR